MFESPEPLAGEAEIVWAPFDVLLADAKIALLSSAGFSVRGEQPEDLGMTRRQTSLCMGKYDIVLILDAPDGEALAKLALTIGSWGNLSTQTMRAFDENEMAAILSNL